MRSRYQNLCNNMRGGTAHKELIVGLSTLSLFPSFTPHSHFLSRSHDSYSMPCFSPFLAQHTHLARKLIRNHHLFILLRSPMLPHSPVNTADSYQLAFQLSNPPVLLRVLVGRSLQLTAEIRVLVLYNAHALLHGRLNRRRWMHCAKAHMCGDLLARFDCQGFPLCGLGGASILLFPLASFERRSEIWEGWGRTSRSVL
jgi:hypothetical protein